jgi:hypothetical protein
MPVHWEFRPSLLVVTSTGVYPLESVAGAVRQAAADPRFEPGMSLLFDGRGSEIPVSSVDVDWRVRFFSSLPSMGFSPRMAMLVREGFLSLFSAGRPFSLLSPTENKGDADGPTLCFFADEDEAIAWLLGGSHG